MLLQNTFGSYLDLLTLVCIPASSKINNYARYAVFSKRLTRNTNMENAFDHIHFVKEATPKHWEGQAILFFNLMKTILVVDIYCYLTTS